MGLCTSKNILKYIGRREALNSFYNGVLQNIYTHTKKILCSLLTYIVFRSKVQLRSIACSEKA